MAKTTRRYGLFRKEGRRWIREYPALAYPLPQARQLFQHALLTGALMPGPTRMLRPATPELPA